MRIRISTPISARVLTAFSLAFVTWMTTSESAAAAPKARVPAPKILSGFSHSERLSITLAFKTAANKVRNRETCRALFEDLDIDGVEALRRT